MNKQKVAKELLKIAKDLVAYTAKVGDIGYLNFAVAKMSVGKSLWADKDWMRNLRNVVNKGSGWVEVVKREDTADGPFITVAPRSYGGTLSHHNVKVRPWQLDFSIPKYENAKALAKALGVGEDFVNTFVSKDEYPVFERDRAWLGLKQEMKIDREMYNNSDDRFRGPEL